MSEGIQPGRSSYDRYRGDIGETLQLIANKYIADQPPRPFVFRASSPDGFLRGEDYRYELDMERRFPDIREGQYVYAWAKSWCEQPSEWPFRLSCFGPVQLYVNGQEAYRANIEEEVFPDRRSWFRLKLEQGWNHFVLRFMKTGTGCGARFGTGSIKGLPMHFLLPSLEREGGEGWLYTPPLESELALIPQAGTSERETGLDWLPRQDWPANAGFAADAIATAASAEVIASEGDAARSGQYVSEGAAAIADEAASECAGGASALERLFGVPTGHIAYAWTGLQCSGGAHNISGTYRGGIAIYVDGAIVFRSVEEGGYSERQSGSSVGGDGLDGGGGYAGTTNRPFSFVAKGGWRARQLVVRSECGDRGWGVQFDPLPAGVKFEQPFPVEGTEEHWYYLGSFRAGSEPDLHRLTATNVVHQTIDGLGCWRLNQPSTTIRPFAETTHYGRWNYPLGVTLYGLLKTGIELGRDNYATYALDHIELCTSYDEYALWDRSVYGAPGVNHQLAHIDTLDDCGSFGAVMLYAMQQRELCGARSAADRIAQYISAKQDRLPDGALYRVFGSTDFMQHTMWCDDLYMSTPFLTRYYELTGDMVYLDDAARQFMLYKQYLYMPEQAIMSHVYDFKFNKPNGVPWGRGNGWVLFSLAELLTAMPEGHPVRSELLDFYRELCAGYLALQGERGLWHQVLDDPESYEETSCTSMFVYAFARGLRLGWLDDQTAYNAAIELGWTALAQYAVDQNGNVYGVCRGSGYSFSRLYYKDDLTWNLNDTHGIGIVMLAGVETMLLRREQPFTA